MEFVKSQGDQNGKLHGAGERKKREKNVTVVMILFQNEKLKNYKFQEYMGNKC